MKYLSGFGGTSTSKVDTLSEELKVDLPEDYRQFLVEYNGGKPTDRYLTFSSSEILTDDSELVLGVMFGIDVDRSDSLYFWSDEHGDELPDSSIIIGREDNSGFLVLVNTEDDKGVYFWDNTHALDGSSHDLNVYKISDSFTGFIDSLVLVK